MKGERKYETYETAAPESMKKAGEEVVSQCKEKINDGTIGLTQCSVDGTWQKSGHNSVNGVVTAVAEGNILILKCYQSIAKAVHYGNRGKKVLYMKWKENSNCKADHFTSSGVQSGEGTVNGKKGNRKDKEEEETALEYQDRLH